MVLPSQWLILSVLALLGCKDQGDPLTAGSAKDPRLSDSLVLSGDGVQLHLRHLGSTSGPPVLLVHGVASNHNSFDLSASRSLAQALADAGMDPWMLDLRGLGAYRGDPAQSWRAAMDWTLDDYAGADVPAAVAFVLEQTGAESLGYVGHSMGGMVGAMYLADNPDAPVYAFVALGSPVDFERADALTSLTMAAGRFAWIPRIDAQLGGELRAALGGAPSTPLDSWVDHRLFNDVDPSARQALYQSVASPIGRGELRHFGQMELQGGLCSADGSVDYGPLLAQVQVPSQVWSGAADQVAPPALVAPLAEQLADAEYQLAGTAQGFAADYGHMDLVLGDNAATEVFPVVSAFLLEHAQREPAP